MFKWKSGNPRLSPMIWRHDYYTLRSLKKAIGSAVSRLLQGGILNKQKSRVLDFGSGSAPYRSLFYENVKEYIAADIAQEAGVDLVFAPAENIPSIDAGTIDLVVSFQVLEHVWDLDWYFAECRRALCDGGRLLLSTHGTWLYHPHPGDYRRWTCDGLIKEIEARGFKVMEIVPVVGPLAWTTQFRTLAYHHLLGKFGPIGKALAGIVSVFMNVRMHIEDKVTPSGLIAKNAAVYLVQAVRQAR